MIGSEAGDVEFNPPPAMSSNGSRTGLLVVDANRAFREGHGLSLSVLLSHMRGAAAIAAAAAPAFSSLRLVRSMRRPPRFVRRHSRNRLALQRRERFGRSYMTVQPVREPIKED
jgi:hypothetical protein